MKKNIKAKEVNAQNKEPKIVTLGKASSLTLGMQGGLLEGRNTRPYRSW